MVQILFHFGIVLSYDQILSFLDELSQSVKVLYNESDNKVLPSKLRHNLFTIFVDDNVDKNSSSVDAKQHFHGTGVSVIQFPTKENSGVARARKKFKLLTENEVQIKDCPGLDEFVTVPSINVSKEVSYPI